MGSGNGQVAGQRGFPGPAFLSGYEDRFHSSASYRNCAKPQTHNFTYTYLRNYVKIHICIKTQRT